MSHIERLVLDTNVLVSLYVFADTRLLPLRHAIASGHWLAFTRDDCLAEFCRVLAYPQFKLDPAAREKAFADYQQLALQFVDPPINDFPLPRCKDRDDQKFLELARDAGAQWLLTADRDLLVLGRRQKLAGRFRILTPDAAIALLTATG